MRMISSALAAACLAWPARARAAEVEDLPVAAAPAPLAALASQLSPALSLDPAALAEAAPADLARFSTVVRRAGALKAAPASLAPAAPPNPAVLSSARAVLGQFSPQDLRALPAPRLAQLAGRIMDGAARPGSGPDGSFGPEDLASGPSPEQAAGAFLRERLGERRAAFVDARGFAEKARRVYLEPASSADALSLSELRQHADARLERLAGSLGRAALSVSRKQGMAASRPALADASFALAAAAGLTETARPAKPALAALDALDGLVSAADRAAASGALSKAARRALYGIRRQARAAIEELASLHALAELGAGREPRPAPLAPDLERAATMMGHLTLHDRSELVSKNAALAHVLGELRAGRDPGRLLVAPDGLLASPQLRRAVEWLPPGSRLAVLGAGAPAVSAAQALLRLNPSAHVALLVPDAFDSALHAPELAEARARGRVSFAFAPKGAFFALPPDEPAAGPQLVLRRAGAGTQVILRENARSAVLETLTGPLIVAGNALPPIL